MIMTRAWTRWQDWVAVVLGLYTLLSPIWVHTAPRVTWTLIVLGAVLALTGLWSLAAPGAVASEYVHMVIGALLFISPWVMRFSGPNFIGAHWTAWIVGVLAVIVGAAALPEANATHRAGLAGQH
jgi:hypothetical protein